MTLFIQISNFHPILVHLPIGILLFAFIMECNNRLRGEARYTDAIRLAIALSLVFSILSLITGLLLAENGDYSEEAIRWHKWSGIIMTIFLAFLTFLERSTKKVHHRWYMPVFSIAVAMLILTGHLGGSLTHGEGFLFGEGQDEGAEIVADVNEAILYDHVIAPLLKRKCNNCHNPSKAKGKLDMTTFTGLEKGGKSGAVFHLSDASESLLLKRIHLPLSEKKHMPPKSKKQLTDDEIKLLEWWIAHGACHECKVKDLNPDQVMASLLESYTVKPVSDDLLFKYTPVEESILNGLNEDGMDVNYFSINDFRVKASLTHEKGVDGRRLERLSKVKNNLVDLDLSYSDVTDISVKRLGKLSNLQKLQLQKTPITSKSISYLNDLPLLASLNLYGTEIDDNAIDDLSKMKGLAKLYIYQTRITEDGFSRLESALPMCDIQYKMDTTIFGAAVLNPPDILIESELFMDSIEVELRSNFRSVSIYYTTDGSAVDTTSLQYSGPFNIDKSTEIRALAFKQGWEISIPVSRRVIKVGQKIKKITSDQVPAEKYSGQGLSTLYDLEKGSTAFTAGNWLGYEGQDVMLDIELEEEASIKDLIISALSAPGSWIFHPRMIDVSLSQDGVNYGETHSLAIDPEKEALPAKMQYFSVGLNGQEARFLKVKITGMKRNPDWHPAPGGKSWLFLDEIIVGVD